MRAGVGIPHDNRVSGAAEALFRENGMTYTVASDIVEILNMIAACPVAEDFPLFCSFGILCGGDVIDHSFDFSRVKNAVHAAGAEVVDGNGCGNFMTENPVQRKNGNSRFWNIHAVGVKNFLRSVHIK